jgi:hypothetical protein
MKILWELSLFVILSEAKDPFGQELLESRWILRFAQNDMLWGVANLTMKAMVCPQTAFAQKRPEARASSLTYSPNLR